MLPGWHAVGDSLIYPLSRRCTHPQLQSILAAKGSWLPPSLKNCPPLNGSCLIQATASHHHHPRSSQWLTDKFDNWPASLPPAGTEALIRFVLQYSQCNQTKASPHHVCLAFSLPYNIPLIPPLLRALRQQMTFSRIPIAGSASNITDLKEYVIL